VRNLSTCAPGRVLLRHTHTRLSRLQIQQSRTSLKPVSSSRISEYSCRSSRLSATVVQSCVSNICIPHAAPSQAHALNDSIGLAPWQRQRRDATETPSRRPRGAAATPSRCRCNALATPPQRRSLPRPPSSRNAHCIMGAPLCTSPQPRGGGDLGTKGPKSRHVVKRPHFQRMLFTLRRHHLHHNVRRIPGRLAAPRPACHVAVVRACHSATSK
jgi:hypothetical protein